MNFYPRPPRGGRLTIRQFLDFLCKFLSTPSARRATIQRIRNDQNSLLFLSTPSARRATKPNTANRRNAHISIHALREEGDQPRPIYPAPPGYFYPRPPRGGRPPSRVLTMDELKFLSTPSARRATPQHRRFYNAQTISIHALREEGDARCLICECRERYFYPRPPRGGRLTPSPQIDADFLFLSTPSARRATVRRQRRWPKSFISIHALREEGDPKERRQHPARWISIHALREEGDSKNREKNILLLSHYTPLCANCKEMLAKQTAKSHRYLRKRLAFRCEASRKTMCAAGSHWPDIKRSARCLGQTPGAVQRARPSSGSRCPAGRTADCPRQGRSGRSALL